MGDVFQQEATCKYNLLVQDKKYQSVAFEKDSNDEFEQLRRRKRLQKR